VLVRVGVPILKPPFVDNAVKPGETWCYVARTEVSLDPLIESRSTNEVCVDVRDITPPAPPVGLSVLPREGKLELTWSPSTEPDLARYRLYRASGGAPARLAELPKTVTNYLDGSAEPGVTYYYTLTAVDESGNESTPSSPAEGRLP